MTLHVNNPVTINQLNVGSIIYPIIVIIIIAANISINHPKTNSFNLLCLSHHMYKPYKIHHAPIDCNGNISIMSNRVLYNANKTGRQFQITAKDVKVISKNFTRTLVLSTVAGLSDRHETTIHAWLKQGEIDYINENDSLFRDLYSNVKRAIANRILILEQKIENNETGWQRFSWLLERTVRKEYSQYGDIMETIETKIAELAMRIAERDKATPKQLTQEVKNWVKESIKEKKEENRNG